MFSLLLLFLVFFVICAMLVFMILLQKGKGEGLAGLMGGVSAADGMGTPEAQKDLSRYTAWLSGIFFGMCLLITVFSTRCGGPVQSNPFGEDIAGATPPTAEEQAIADEFASPELIASPEATATAVTPEAETLELLREATARAEAEGLRSEISPEAAVPGPQIDPNPRNSTRSPWHRPSSKGMLASSTKTGEPTMQPSEGLPIQDYPEDTQTNDQPLPPATEDLTTEPASPDVELP